MTLQPGSFWKARRVGPTVRLVVCAICALVALAEALPASSWDEFMVIATDFTTHGAIASVERQAPWTVTPNRQAVSSDAIARYHDGLYYVVNRGGASNLQVIDPSDGYRTLRQFSLGAGLNPQDIAFGPDGLAYVSCYAQAVLLKVDTVVGAVVGSISTAAFADADGLPETAWMLARGNLLYVACLRLDSHNWYVPTGASSLAIYDMSAAAWVDAVPATPQLDAILLAGTNPFCEIEPVPGLERVRIACTGWYGALDGGVEVVDLVGRVSLGFEVTEAALGGDLLDFVTTGSQRGYAIVSDVQFRTSVVAYDPVGGTLIATILPPVGYNHADLAYDGDDLLYVADRTTGNSGLRVFDAPTGAQLTTAPRSTGLPPFYIALPVEAALTGLDDLPASVVRLFRPWPNPANPGCSVAFEAPAGRTVSIAAFDLRGRRVAVWRPTAGADGRGVIRFDGHDSAGRPLPSGLYLFALEGVGPSAMTSVIIAR